MSTAHVFSTEDDQSRHDMDGECPCIPGVRRIKRGDGSDGWLIFHQAPRLYGLLLTTEQLAAFQEAVEDDL